MKRRLFMVLLLLVAGAIVNVAVAWTIGLAVDPLAQAWGHPQGSWEQSIDYGDTVWVVWRNRRIGSLWVVSSPRYRPSYDRPDKGPPPLTLVPIWAADELVPREIISTTDSTFEASYRTIHATGWPSLAMAGVFAGCSSAEQPLSMSALKLGLAPWEIGPRVAGQFQVPRSIQLRPLWTGFAINTVFYAFILWLLFIAPFTVRRWRRIKRGLCPKCAYDLRNRPSDSSVCPECGATAG